MVDTDGGWSPSPGNPEPSRTRAELIWRFTWPFLGLLVLGVVLLALFWFIAPRTVLEAYNQPFPVDVYSFNPATDKSRIIILHLNVCKKVAAKGEVIVTLVGQTKVELPWPADDSNKYCLNKGIPIQLPPNISPGKRHLEFDILYRVNPLRKQEVHLRSEDFTL